MYTMQPGEDVTHFKILFKNFDSYVHELNHFVWDIHVPCKPLNVFFVVDVT